MYNNYNFLIELKSPIDTESSSAIPPDCKYQYTIIMGAVVASSEDIAKELIEEYFVENTNNTLVSCEIELINNVISGIQDYKVLRLHYDID